MAKKPAKEYKYTKVKDPRPKTHAERKADKYKKHVEQSKKFVEARKSNKKST